jgi:D-alanyl-D-alanine carboxypeptidase/D-alanyl-D-alanine-endopeptidase (penicillin-binding protein 4)
VINECRSTRRAGKAVPMVGRRPGTNELVLRGRVSKRGTLQSVAVTRPNEVAAAAIREGLEARGIDIRGETRFDPLRRRGATIPDAVLIDRHRTSFADVLRRIGVDSQNMCAESMCKRLGYYASLSADPKTAEGSWATGISFMRSELSRMGCSADDFVIADASGLARTNRATARGFVRVLQAMFKHPRRDALLASLAGNVNGGRLGRRLADLDGQVFAKTGYIRGVRGLSGYVRSTDDRWTAFSVIFNGIRGGTAPYNRIHEQLCAILAEPVEGHR